MNIPKVGFSLGPLVSAGDLISCARMADERGADSVWVPESWGRESFSTLGALSQVTAKARLGTSILSIYSRTPATVAMGATTIDLLSSGRAVIGLGASTPAIVENWHGAKFDAPLARMREFVECVRLMASGERVNYDGRFFKTKGFKLLHRPARATVPILMGAVNRGMLELAAEIADGVILYLRPLEELRKTTRWLKQSACRGNFEIACSIICAVSDEEPELARRRAAQTLAFYVAVGKFYRDFLSANGYRVEAEAISKAYASDGIEKATDMVSDGMLNALAVCGTGQQCREALDRFIAAGVTLPILQFNPAGSTESSFRELLSTF